MSAIVAGTTAHGELGDRLAALRSDFAALGARAAGAAKALAATLPPPSGLLDELTAARTAFTQLRAAMVEKAGTLSIVLDAEGLGTLRDLEPVLAAIGAAEAHRARLVAWDAARRDALAVLARVAALVHREDKSFPALGECQALARALHETLSGPAPEAVEQETQQLPERLRVYGDLLALVEGWNVLDDDRCAALQDHVTDAFGRALALAALRGKIGRQGEAPPAAAAARARVRPAAAPVEPVLERIAPPAAVPTGAPPRVAPPRVAPPAAPVAPAVAAPAAPPAPVVAPPSPIPEPVIARAEPVVTEDAGVGLENPGLGDEVLAAEDSAARREQEEELERLARQTAPWWIAARAGWHGLRERGLTFGDAAHDYLKRFPYLLSVPLRRSAEYEGGLAEGYALLLTHIDKQEVGFVQEALTRLNPQFGTRDPSQPYPLGQELYSYVVAEGRLYKTYPDFVREVVAHAVPTPGAWVQGGIVEGDDETRLFMRAEGPGSGEEQTRTLTEPKERLGPHLFKVTLGSLTARFFTVKLAGEALVDPPNVEIKLKENDSPTDHAWLTVLPASGKAIPAPRKHRAGGTTLEELGKQFGGFWMAIFNADPNNDRHYELSIILRRKPAPISGPNAKPAPGPERFFGKKK